MKVTKFTEGYVTQIFEEDVLISQDFTARGDEVYEDEEGEPIFEMNTWPEAPFNMQQPKGNS